MQWFYVKNGEKAGPISTADLSTFEHRGEITEETLVWNEQMADWQPYGTVKPAQAAADINAAPDAAVSMNDDRCSLCGKPFPADELIPFEGRNVCAQCKPAFIQQMKENAELSGTLVMNYAGFWIRAGAVFIDGILLYVVQLPLIFLFGLFSSTNPEGPAMVAGFVVYYTLQILIPALYSILMIGKYGATVGKKAVGVKVVMADGSKVSYGRATGRYFAKVLNGFTLNIGYLIAAFDGEKRGLHDHICSTRVIRK